MSIFDKKFTLKVEQQDIDNSIPRDGDKCAIAQAINRHPPNKSIHRGIVNQDYIRFIYKNRNDTEESYRTTPYLREWITDFDSGNKVDPIEIRFIPRTKEAAID